MQRNTILTQPNTLNNLAPPPEQPSLSTRRQFLAGVLELSALTILPLSALIPTESAPDSTRSPRPAAYPDATRAALIEHWQGRIEETIEALDNLQSFLSAAIFLAPADMDGERFFDLEGETINAMDDLSREMQTLDFDELVTAVTGSRSYVTVIKKEIREGKLSREKLQAEINAIRQDYPTDADMLQAVLDSEYGGAL
jgi:hypothetical protein